MKQAVEAENLAKSYDRLIALDDVTFTMGKGTFFVPLGPYGAGKTTRMRNITMLTRLRWASLCHGV